MYQYDVVALGELLIDFTLNGVSGQRNGMYEANPGGAPCNVLAMLQKLGKTTAFIGKVGNDFFGTLLLDTVNGLGIDISNLVMDEDVPTTLAFVYTKEDGDRSFSFYRNPGADMMLRFDEVKEELLRQTKIFHFGSLSMTEKEIEYTTKMSVEKAKQFGALISFDPNLRPSLWNRLGRAKEMIEYGLSKTDILKISDDEIEFMTGKKDIDEGVRRLQDQYHIPFLCATMGKNGSKVFYKDYKVECEAFHRKNTVDTTGAGDTFCACMLNAIIETGMEHMGEKELFEMLRFANAAASLITTKKGALNVMPEEDMVWDSIK